MKRGAVTAAQSEFVGTWMPIPLVNGLDEAVQLQDSDRSKFIRRAVAEKIEKMKTEAV